MVRPKALCSAGNELIFCVCVAYMSEGVLEGGQLHVCASPWVHVCGAQRLMLALSLVALHLTFHTSILSTKLHPRLTEKLIPRGRISQSLYPRSSQLGDENFVEGRGKSKEHHSESREQYVKRQ